MNAELKSIFGSSIVVGTSTVPTAHLRYKGTSKTYVIWTITGNTPSVSGNDEDLYGVTTVDIDVYSDGNYLNVVKRVKELMKENDWTWGEDSSEMYEEDTSLYHVTCSFMKGRSI